MAPQEFVRRELRVGKHTLVDWNNFLQRRTFVVKWIVQLDCEQIGGTGCIVQIDERKFGKRKYHRGRKVDDVWVYGAWNTASDKQVFFLGGVG